MCLLCPSSAEPAPGRRRGAQETCGQRPRPACCAPGGRRDDGPKRAVGEVTTKAWLRARGNHARPPASSLNGASSPRQNCISPSITKKPSGSRVWTCSGDAWPAGAQLSVTPIRPAASARSARIATIESRNARNVPEPTADSRPVMAIPRLDSPHGVPRTSSRCAAAAARPLRGRWAQPGLLRQPPIAPNGRRAGCRHTIGWRLVPTLPGDVAGGHRGSPVRGNCAGSEPEQRFEGTLRPEVRGRSDGGCDWSGRSCISGEQWRGHRRGRRCAGGCRHPEPLGPGSCDAR